MSSGFTMIQTFPLLETEFCTACRVLHVVGDRCNCPPLALPPSSLFDPECNRCKERLSAHANRKAYTLATDRWRCVDGGDYVGRILLPVALARDPDAHLGAVCE
jgi:hypothetical protein